jgi:hypothetical protein
VPFNQRHTECAGYFENTTLIDFPVLTVMNMLALAWKNLRRRPARWGLTIIGLSVAVAVVVSLVGLSQSLESSFLSLYTRRGADLVVQRRGGTVQLAKGLPLALADRIETMPGVKVVIRGLMDMVAFEKQGLFMVIVNGWGRRGWRSEYDGHERAGAEAGDRGLPSDGLAEAASGATDRNRSPAFGRGRGRAGKRSGHRDSQRALAPARDIRAGPRRADFSHGSRHALDVLHGDARRRLAGLAGHGRAAGRCAAGKMTSLPPLAIATGIVILTVEACYHPNP